MDRLRELVRVRDRYKCQKCKSKWVEGERRFDTHHLDEKYEGLNGGKGFYKIDKNILKRIVTLCHKCHLNLHSVRVKMKKSFRKKHILDKDIPKRVKVIKKMRRENKTFKEVVLFLGIKPQTLNSFCKKYC